MVERAWVYSQLFGQGVIGIEMYTPDILYKGDGAFYPDMDERMVVGRGLTHILACNAIWPISKLGPYSIAELAMAQLLDIPTAGWNEVKDMSEPRVIDCDHLARLKDDRTSIADHMKGSGLLELMTREMTSMEGEELGSITFWGCIESYLRDPTKLIGLVPDSLVKYRLKSLFEGDDYPLFAQITPKIEDCRPMLWWIGGKLTKVNVYDFDTDSDDTIVGFWHITDDGEMVYCRWTRNGNNYETVPEAEWIDD